MPRNAITTNVSPSELKVIDDACAKLNLTRYRFIRKAALDVAKHIMEDEKNVRKGKNGVGTEKRRQRTLTPDY